MKYMFKYQLEIGRHALDKKKTEFHLPIHLYNYVRMYTIQDKLVGYFIAQKNSEKRVIIYPICDKKKLADFRCEFI